MQQERPLPEAGRVPHKQRFGRSRNKRSAAIPAVWQQGIAVFTVVSRYRSLPQYLQTCLVENRSAEVSNSLSLVPVMPQLLVSGIPMPNPCPTAIGLFPIVG